jgi:hypothetical protein
VIVTGELATVALPVIVAVPVAVPTVAGALHCTRIVHDAPAASVPGKVVGQFAGRPVNEPVLTRENGNVTTGATVNVNVVVPLFDTTRSRVATVLTTTSLNSSGAGFATTSVLPAAS